jgi:hypothetical protein
LTRSRRSRPSTRYYCRPCATHREGEQAKTLRCRSDQGHRERFPQSRSRCRLDPTAQAAAERGERPQAAPSLVARRPRRRATHAHAARSRSTAGSVQRDDLQ